MFVLRQLGPGQEPPPDAPALPNAAAAFLNTRVVNGWLHSNYRVEEVAEWNWLTMRIFQAVMTSADPRPDAEAEADAG